MGNHRFTLGPPPARRRVRRRPLLPSPSLPVEEPPGLQLRPRGDSEGGLKVAAAVRVVEVLVAAGVGKVYHLVDIVGYKLILL